MRNQDGELVVKYPTSWCCLDTNCQIILLIIIGILFILDGCSVFSRTYRKSVFAYSYSLSGIIIYVLAFIAYFLKIPFFYMLFIVWNAFHIGFLVFLLAMICCTFFLTPLIWGDLGARHQKKLPKSVRGSIRRHAESMLSKRAGRDTGAQTNDAPVVINAHLDEFVTVEKNPHIDSTKADPDVGPSEVGPSALIDPKRDYIKTTITQTLTVCDDKKTATTTTRTTPVGMAPKPSSAAFAQPTTAQNEHHRRDSGCHCNADEDLLPKHFVATASITAIILIPIILFALAFYVWLEAVAVVAYKHILFDQQFAGNESVVIINV